MGQGYKKIRIEEVIHFSTSKSAWHLSSCDLLILMHIINIQKAYFCFESGSVGVSAGNERTNNSAKFRDTVAK